MSFRPCIGAGLALLLAACDRAPDAPGGDPVTATSASVPAAVLRLPKDGGTAELYRVPDLAEADWTSETKLPPLASLVGSDVDQRVVLAVDRKGKLVALSLEYDRLRTFAEQVRSAALGPDGSIYTVDSAGVVTRLMRQIASRYPDTLTASRALFGALGGRLVAFSDSAPAGLTVLAPDAPAKRVAIPEGPATATYWGDLVAVTTDSGVVVYDPQGKNPLRTIDVGATPRTAIFSPSGHRLYVVAKDRPTLSIVDRFGGTVLGTIELPGLAADLRNGSLGHWLLVRPAEGDSVWVVDVARSRVAGTAAGGWQDDLPAVAAKPTLIVRQGDDVVTLALDAEGLPERGRIEDGADDFWLPVEWSPEPKLDAPVVASATPTGEPEVDMPPDSADAAEPEDDDEASTRPERVFLQVSSSQNGEWASELAGQLKRAGLPASVLDPRREGDPYRVVLGPYGSRAEAEETSRQLGRPSFIIGADEAAVQ